MLKEIKSKVEEVVDFNLDQKTKSRVFVGIGFIIILLAILVIVNQQEKKHILEGVEVNCEFGLLYHRYKKTPIYDTDGKIMHCTYDNYGNVILGDE